MKDTYQILARAIVIQAAKDYRKAIKCLKRNPYNKAARESKDGIEEFFRSDWYKTLTILDPELLMVRIKEEIN